MNGVCESSPIPSIFYIKECLLFIGVMRCNFSFLPLIGVVNVGQWKSTLWFLVHIRTMIRAT